MAVKVCAEGALNDVDHVAKYGPVRGGRRGRHRQRDPPGRSRRSRGPPCTSRRARRVPTRANQLRRDLGHDLVGQPAEVARPPWGAGLGRQNARAVCRRFSSPCTGMVIDVPSFGVGVWPGEGRHSRRNGSCPCVGTSWAAGWPHANPGRMRQSAPAHSVGVPAAGCQEAVTRSATAWGDLVGG